MSAPDPATSACPNCSHPFAGPRPMFCPACGQETQVKAPTLGEFLQQFGGACFSSDGAFLVPAGGGDAAVPVDAGAEDAAGQRPQRPHGRRAHRRGTHFAVPLGWPSSTFTV